MITSGPSSEILNIGYRAIPKVASINRKPILQDNGNDAYVYIEESLRDDESLAQLASQIADLAVKAAPDDLPNSEMQAEDFKEIAYKIANVLSTLPDPSEKISKFALAIENRLQDVKRNIRNIGITMDDALNKVMGDVLNKVS